MRSRGFQANSARTIWCPASISASWRWWSSQPKPWAGGFHWWTRKKRKLPEGCSLRSEPHPEAQMFFQVNPKAPTRLWGPHKHLVWSSWRLHSWVSLAAAPPPSFPGWADDHFKGLLSCGILVPLALARNHQPRGVWRRKRRERGNICQLSYSHLNKAFCWELSLSLDEDSARRNRAY
jgi:hypothetical protein